MPYPNGSRRDRNGDVDYESGKPDENLVAGILKTRGWYVTFLSRSSEQGPPMAHGKSGGKIILPDILALRVEPSFDAGRSIFVEVKGKERPTYYRREKKYQHGIELAQYVDYMRISRESGIPVMLAIHERACGVVLAFDLGEYDSPRAFEDAGMIYFDRDRMWIAKRGDPDTEQDMLDAAFDLDGGASA